MLADALCCKLFQAKWKRRLQGATPKVEISGTKTDSGAAGTSSDGVGGSQCERLGVDSFVK